MRKLTRKEYEKRIAAGITLSIGSLLLIIPFYINPYFRDSIITLLFTNLLVWFSGYTASIALAMFVIRRYFIREGEI